MSIGSTKSDGKKMLLKTRSGIGPRWHNAKKEGKKSKGSERTKDELNQVMGIIMAQVSGIDKHAHVSVNEGVKRHGSEALHALLSEFGQIHKHDTFEPLDIK